MTGQMVIVIALPGFNDLRNSLTPIFLLVNHFLYRFSTFNKKKMKKMVYQSFKSYEKKAFINDLQQVPWNVIEGVGDIDDTVFLWEKLFRDCSDHHAPIKSRCYKESQLLRFLPNFWN